MQKSHGEVSNWCAGRILAGFAPPPPRRLRRRGPPPPLRGVGDRAIGFLLLPRAAGEGDREAVEGALPSKFNLLGAISSLFVSGKSSYPNRCERRRPESRSGPRPGGVAG